MAGIRLSRIINDNSMSTIAFGLSPAATSTVCQTRGKTGNTDHDVLIFNLGGGHSASLVLIPWHS